MNQLTKNNFNIEPLVFEIQNVIKKGLSTILKDYTDRYELLENTHNQIMNLPSVLNELNKNSKSDETSDSDLEENEKPNFISIKDMTYNIVREEIEIIENRLDKMEKKFDSIVPILDKILGKMQTLNEDVKGLKNEEKETAEYKTVYMTHPVSNLVIKPSIVTSSADENIKFEIEADIESGNEDEDEDEDDVNPAMITCSTINLKTIQVEEEEEELVSEEEQSDEEEQSEEEEELVSEEEQSDEEEQSEEEEELVSEEEELVSEEEELVSEVEEELVSEVEEELVEEVEEELVSEVEEELVSEVEEEQIVEEEEQVVEEKSALIDEVETEASEEENEEDELIVITIDDIDYCTNNEENGFIYELNDEGEQGDKIGYLKEGEPFFYSDEN
jgi:hypothetical protein